MAGVYGKLDDRIMLLLKSKHPEVVGVEEIYSTLKEFAESINIIDRRMQYLKKKGLVYNKRCYGWGLLNHG